MSDPANPLVGPLQTLWDWRAAMNWIFGGSHRLEGPSQQTRFDEDVFAINLNGEPLSTWAGPVSFATGFEYRKDGYNVWGDPASTGQCSSAVKRPVAKAPRPAIDAWPSVMWPEKPVIASA